MQDIETNSNSRKTSSAVTVKVADGIATVSLDRPDRMNALDFDMKAALLAAFRGFVNDAAVRCVLLCGNAKAFCAGSDVGTFARFTVGPGRRRVVSGQEIIRAINELEKPVIAAVGGAAVGVGWSLALASDYILASPSARFGQVFRKLGLAPDGGAVFFLAQYVGVLRAKELALTGRMLSGEEAMQLGLVTELVDNAALLARAHALAQDLAQGPTLAFGLTKRLFAHAHASDLGRFLDVEAHVQNQLFQTNDHQEGVAAFRQKRAPSFTNA